MDVLKQRVEREVLKERLMEAGQEHVGRYWDELTEEEKQGLFKDVVENNIEESSRFFERCMGQEVRKVEDTMRPVPSEQTGGTVTTSRADLDGYFQAGLDAIGRGEVGVVLMAGGQGTRLGVSYPKGCYDIGLPSKKSLFQLQVERLKKLETMACSKNGKRPEIPLYVMTSAPTRAATESFFVENDFFGISQSQVTFFDQGTLPCFTFDGKLILASKSSLAIAPDGNGGLYRALGKWGIVKDMKTRGLKYLHVYCVDNCLVRVADPYFIGFGIAQGADCVAKVVEKKDPNEAVGVVCLVEDVPSVVEYSEITSDTAKKLDGDHKGEGDKLLFRAGNIANHLFTLDFLSDVVTDHESDLVHHVAKKKIPFIDENGELVKPDKPNGIKMEKFVFDVFRFSKKFAVWEVAREEEFSPLKNSDAAGKDCPRTSRLDIHRLHCSWLKEANVVVDERDWGEVEQDGVLPIEIPASVSYCGEGLKEINFVGRKGMEVMVEKLLKALE